jgi:putative transposase
MPRSTSPHASALRKGRVSMPGQTYHVITRCPRGSQPFSNPTIAFAACKNLHRATSLLDSKPHAWVLMPDHLHLLIELGETSTLSSLIAQCKRSIASATNEVRGTLGASVWQAGFYDRALRREDNVAVVSRYVIANPVNAKLVARVEDYPWWGSTWL